MFTPTGRDHFNSRLIPARPPPQSRRNLRNDYVSKARRLGREPTAGAQVAVTAGILSSFMVGGAKIDDMPVVIADFFGPC